MKTLKTEQNKHHTEYQTMFRNDPFDNLVYKICKFLSPRDRSLIQNAILYAQTNPTQLPQVLTNISNIVLKHTLNHPIQRDAHRQDFIAGKLFAYLRKHMGNVPDTLQVADIGGGNGDVLSALQEKLPTSKPEQFVCVETASDWVESYEHNHANIVYEFWDNDSMKLPDAHFDVVLCMVSLHHMPEPTFARAVSEIVRILKPNGVLLVKEHDARSKSAHLLIEWEHHLYHVVDCAYTQDAINPQTYMEKSVHRFRSMTEWRSVFEHHGLTHLETTNRFLDGAYKPHDEKNPTQLYWDIFVR